jgi:5-methylcytosine-specific restriction endonuclease McrA
MKGNVNSPKGEECWNWKGGVTPVRKMIRNSVKYKEWRTKVFERDNWTCQNCKKKGVYIEADHYPDPFCKICERNNIETLEDAMECKELWQISKGRTLCKKCHYKIGWSLFREENPHSNY